MNLEIDKGRRFLIGDISFDFKSVLDLIEIHFDELKKDFDELKVKKLNHKFYSKDAVKKIEIKIKEILESKGFMNFDLSLRKNIDQKSRRVSLAFLSHWIKERSLFFGAITFFQNRIY